MSRRILEALAELAQHRRTRLQDIDSAHRAALAKAEADHQRATQKQIEPLSARITRLEADHQAARRAAEARANELRQELDRQIEETRLRNERESLRAIKELAARTKQERFEVTAAYQLSRQGLNEEFLRGQAIRKALRGRGDAARQSAMAILAHNGLAWHWSERPEPGTSIGEDYLSQAESSLAEARQLIETLAIALPSRWERGGRLEFFGIAIGGVATAILTQALSLALAAGAGMLVAIFAYLVGRKAVRRAARLHAESLLERIDHELTSVDAALIDWNRAEKNRYDAERSRLKQVRRDDRRAVQQSLRDGKILLQRKEEAARRAQEALAARREERDRDVSEQARRSEDDFAASYSALVDQRDQQIETAHSRRTTEIEAAAQAREASIEALKRNWRRGIQSAMADAQSLAVASALAVDGTASSMPKFVLIGHAGVSLERLLGEAPAADWNEHLPAEIAVPVALAFPEEFNLGIRVLRQGSPTADRFVLACLWRLLLHCPPGRVRFCLVEPRTLGRNFAGLLRLADYDPDLVGTRVWTEPNDIEEALGDWKERVKVLIQSRLRDEFARIEDFNEAAGILAEPYRVLAFSGIPAGCSETTLGRLRDSLAAGPRCGMYGIWSWDPAVPLPAGLSAKEVAFLDSPLAAGEGRIEWASPLGPLELVPCPIPSGDEAARILDAIGAAARAAKRIEVPFATIAPPPERVWAGDAADKLRIPIGRAGATHCQYLELGEGTAQHVLLAGRTGSGKSTLLHTLITSAALTYPPRELELYLVDFKKGVEFAAYVEGKLPHARVIAVESEREFGLSVLGRLDQVLAERGEEFRAAGATSVGGYRQKAGRPLPRILLLVDEFQELFVEDDSLARDASLYLDRLVRQGRAFGMHVLLGSQTLGGAYSLPRSTLGQMNVRIALQCSETDAALILGDDNPAARSLHRPGEGIYNPAGGARESNQLFQVAFLSDADRRERLGELRRLALDHDLNVPPPIVFEGGAPASLDRCLPLERAPFEELVGPTAWLGEPIAIAPPLAVSFGPEAGAHLLIVGSKEPIASGLLFASLLSLARTTQPNARFILLAPKGPLAEAIASCRWLHSDGRLRVAGPAEVASVFAELAASWGEASAEPTARTFVFLAGLERFRELRQSDDDYSFRKESLTPAALLATLLKEGPPLGWHVVAWAGSLAALERGMERRVMREFGHRVLLQMSSADSSSLADSPLAGSLGPDRALYVDSAAGRWEKFRPYALPSAELLSRIGELPQSAPAPDGR